MQFKTLDDWLQWQTSVHPSEIDLGLQRVRKVAERLDLLAPTCPVISVAGTNGKGSSIAMLDAILTRFGLRTGVYTSPHLQQYNERIRVAGEMAEDQAIMAAFQAIDQAREDVSLTYFEFGTLAALWVFRQQAVDIMLLEVGLGGRLDAVNILDADIALISVIGIDHTEWLGDTREKIAVEKAGIARRGHPVVCADPNPPETLPWVLQSKQAEYSQVGQDFGFNREGDGWRWWFGEHMNQRLPMPSLQGEHQLQNAAGVLAVCQLLPASLRPDWSAVEYGLQNIHIHGRFERYQIEGVNLILDVAHNPDGVYQQVQTLRQHPVSGKTWVMLGIMQDKDAKGICAALAEVTDHWLLVTPQVQRAMPAEQLAETVASVTSQSPHEIIPAIPDAWAFARQHLKPQDRLLVTGSFITVGEMRGCFDLPQA